jgi:hypothetical protein
MRLIRQVHLYIGTLFAPAIIFFALTGALQTVELHESKEGAKPAVWIATVADIHKHQRLPGPPPGTPLPTTGAQTTPVSPAAAQNETSTPNPAATTPAGTESAPPRPQRAPRRKPSLPLKAFILIMSVGLIASTLLGIYMSFQLNRSRSLVWTLLVLGSLIPAVLIYF